MKCSAEVDAILRGALELVRTRGWSKGETALDESWHAVAWDRPAAAALQ